MLHHRQEARCNFGPIWELVKKYDFWQSIGGFFNTQKVDISVVLVHNIGRIILKCRKSGTFCKTLKEIENIIYIFLFFLMLLLFMHFIAILKQGQLQTLL